MQRIRDLKETEIERIQKLKGKEKKEAMTQWVIDHCHQCGEVLLPDAKDEMETGLCRPCLIVWRRR